MQKILSVFIFFVLLFFLLDGQASASVRNEYKIPLAVNDNLIDFPDAKPFVTNSTTYVPIRQLVDAIGGTLTVSKELITIKKGSLSLQLFRNENLVITSKQEQLPLQIFIRNNRTYAPVRFIGEYFGYKVMYVSEGPIVRLTNTDTILSNGQLIKNYENEIRSFYSISSKNQVYLTFDDGPNNYTDQILDILKMKNVKGTFFMLEPNMKRYSEEVKRIVAEGHYPALHSVTHNKNILYNSRANNVVIEMEKTRQTLMKIANFDSKLSRAPYGSKPFMTKAFRDKLVQESFKMWDWNVDSEDWKYQRSNPERIIQNVKNGINRLEGTKDPIVILFHDSKGTALVLPKIIDFLQGKGYECVQYNPNNHYVVNFWKDARL